MLRHTLLVLALVGCVLGARLPVRRLVNSGHRSRVGAAAGRIVGGQEATSGQFPYQVSLQYTKLFTRSHTCGGSIISTTRVLTAAHCIMDTGTYYAVAGEVDFSSEDGTEQESQVLQQIPHPDFPGGLQIHPNDIAVFTLSSAFSLNSYVQTIPLASAGSIPTAGSTGIASGWGATAYTEAPDILQWVEVTIVDFPTCRQLIDDMGIEDNFVVDTMVCTGPVTGGISLCGGDSGGPLVQDGVLIGVAQWAYGMCGFEGAPSGCTRVSAFIDFINDNL
ncbi:trypsin-1-like [Schistocerca cancellata]|uniref:trypsin-1-like n=1 Tax=Schistocerca cancellata TaxID=274614 RepID=UPI002117F484|nr:trypsin-1-like [Schistocerca cancellata]